MKRNFLKSNASYGDDEGQPPSKKPKIMEYQIGENPSKKVKEKRKDIMISCSAKFRAKLLTLNELLNTNAIKNGMILKELIQCQQENVSRMIDLECLNWSYKQIS